MTPRKTVLILAAAMGIFACAGLFAGELGPLARNSTKDAGLLAIALTGVAASFGGRHICVIFLVATGTLLLIDAFMGISRGVFYLDFVFLTQPVSPLVGWARFYAALPDMLFGLPAMMAGMLFSSDETPDQPT